MRTPSSLILAALLALTAACNNADGEGKAKGERAAPVVRVEAVQPATFTNSIDAVGTAVANEQVVVAAPVTERIIRLNFDDGAFVQRGQVLAVLQQAEQTAQLREV